MWNKDSTRRFSPMPRNAFPPSPRQFPPPPVSNSTYPPPLRPFFRNTFSPVRGVPPVRDSSPSHVPHSSDTSLQSSFSFGKHHGGVSLLSSSEILRAPYSPGKFMSPEQNRPPTPSAEQFPKSSYLKTEVNVEKRFGFQNSPSPQVPFTAERKSFGGIPFISDATADSSSPYSNHNLPLSPVMKQEEDSMDYFYNRHALNDENRESAHSQSFDKGNSSLDQSAFSQKSDDSYASEESQCEPNANEDSQSRSSFPVIDSAGDTRKPTRFFSEDGHPMSGDGVENSSKRQKLSHELSNDEIVDVKGSDLDKRVKQGGSAIGDSMENSSKCQQSDHDMDSSTADVQKSELEKHITEIFEPVVGLDHLTEFKKENVSPSQYMYKCSLCKCSILAKHVLMHILSVKHRLRYLKAMDESEHQRIMKLRANQEELAGLVVDAVSLLEMKNGRGSVKVELVPSSEAKNSEDKSPEDSFTVSPTIVPPADSLLLEEIPEPPDLKLLNDILSTAQNLRSGVSPEFFQFPAIGKNEEPPKDESAEYKTETTRPNWQVGCKIPPPPPLPLTEATSPWNHNVSSCETSPVVKSPSNVNAADSHMMPPPLTSYSSKTEFPQKCTPEQMSGILTKDLPTLPIKTENSDHTASHQVMSQAAFSGSDDLKLKTDPTEEHGLEALPKIPLINDNDTVCNTTGRSNGTPESLNVPSPFKEMPAEGSVLTEEEEELGKAAIFEHLSLCTITNEAEANLVEKIICFLSEMYFAYKLRDLPKSESESLLQALRIGEKEGTEKLTSILYRQPTTSGSVSENDGNCNVGEENSMKHENVDFSSPLRPEKSDESIIVKSSTDPIPSSTQEVDDSKSVLNSLSPPDCDQSNNNGINSPSSLAGGVTKLNDGNKDVAEHTDAKQGTNEGLAASKEAENTQNLVELTFLQPPPPPPPPPTESASQISVSEQSGYPQTSVSEQPSYPQTSVSEQPSYPQTSVSEQPSYPQTSVSEQPSYPQTSVSEQPSYPQTSVSEGSSYPQTSVSEQSSYPQTSVSGQSSYPQTSVSGQSSYPQTSVSGQSSYPQTSVSGQSSYPQTSVSGQSSYPQTSVSGQSSYPQTSVSEQSSYSQVSTSYGGWPMSYYPGATQTGGYMYWPPQSLGGVDPSVMNTQYMIQAQNFDTSLYTWCQQAPPPPLPPPPPPPPPPPGSSAP